MSKNEKIRILKHFSWGVGGYVISTAVVLLLPAFVSNQPGEEAVRVVLIGQNLVLWVFMGSLAWIFRCAPPLWATPHPFAFPWAPPVPTLFI